MQTKAAMVQVWQGRWGEPKFEILMPHVHLSPSIPRTAQIAPQVFADVITEVPWYGSYRQRGRSRLTRAKYHNGTKFNFVNMCATPPALGYHRHLAR